MSTTVNVSGTNYSVPTIGESNWGENTTALLIQLSSSTKVFQTTSSSFQLAQDVDFGATYGIKLAYLKSKAANPSSTGIIRLGNAESIGFRNAANSGDLLLTANASDQLTYNGTALQGAVSVSDSSTIDLTLTGSAISAIVVADSLTDSHINSAAAIAYSKLSLATSIVNADIATLAAIAYSKLNLSASIVDADINASAAIAYSKLSLATSIVNADIATSANIDASKLGTGIVSTTEFNCLDGVTSAIQGQIDLKAPIASPAFTGTVSGITKAMVGLTNVDDTSDATKNAAVATLTNKTLTSPAINTATITTPSIVTPSRLDMKRDTLANLQTYAATATDGQLVYATDTLATYVVKSSALSAVGGSGNANSILSPDADSGIGLWATYKNASGASTPDGTITGTANSTFAVSASTALRGTSNFLFTKNSGASRIGEGFYYPFTIDNSDKGKVLQCSFEYQIASGTFVDDAMEFFIWDVTNSRLISPAPSKLKNSGIIERFAFEFQSSIDSTSYRLFAHIGVSTDSSNTIRFDNFNISNQAKLYGSNVTDWIAYTPTFTGFGTVSSVEAYWRKVGGNIELSIKFANGTATAVEARASLPNGLTSASTDLIAGTHQCGIYATSPSSTNTHGGFALITANVGYITFSTPGIFGSSATAPLSAANGSSLTISGSGESLAITASLPIKGWSSSQVMSSDANTRVVAAIITGNPASATVGNPIIVPTVSYDSHGSYNATTGRYTCTSPGIYKVYGALTSASSATTLTIYKNAASTSLAGNLDSNGEATFCSAVNCVAGDVLDIRPGGTVDATDMTLNFEKISGPSQIAASESVSASYYVSANFAATTTTPINFDTKEWDSHNAVTPSATVWKFTAPMSGVYVLNGFIGSSGGAYFMVYKNGSVYKTLLYSTASNPTSGSATVRLLAGEYIDIRPSSSVTATGGTLSTSGTAHVHITRQANY